MTPSTQPSAQRPRRIYDPERDLWAFPDGSGVVTREQRIIPLTTHVQKYNPQPLTDHR